MARTKYNMRSVARCMSQVLAGASCFGMLACSPQDGLLDRGAGGWPSTSIKQLEGGPMREGAAAGADRFPLSAAPLVWSERQKLLAGGGAENDYFGYSVSLSGDTALVGAWGDDDAGESSGAAYVLVRSATGWAEQGKLLAGDGAAFDFFGHRVSLSGDTALVGARKDDDAGTSSGAAYVFVRSATVWTEQGKLLAGDGAEFDYFGHRVSVAGDTALVGARKDDDAGTSSGAAYVFVRSATVWTEQGKLLAGDGAEFDDFGESVSLSGDTALVGAGGDDDAGTSSGAAYVFVRSATVWTEQGKLLAGGGAADDYFGHRVSVAGDTALVGAHGDDDAGTSSGAAYVFVRSATVWTEQGKLLAGDGAAFDNFGESVSLSGDTALVGAHGDDDAGSSSGSAYVFVRSATGWTEQGKLLAGDGAVADSFGYSVSLAGDTALVGAWAEDDAGSYAGSAYAFVRSATVWTEQNKLLAGDGATDDYFGWSVSVAGDTALVGAYRDDDAGSTSGSAYVFSLRLVDGQSCGADEACASKSCVDGVCCDSACGGACEACDVAGLEGVCAPIARGSTPTLSCDGHLCNGAIGACPIDCAGNEDCSSTHHCPNALGCVPKEANGQLCSGHRACLSGHCVDGICCSDACDQGCGSCVLRGQEGVCTPLGQDHSGTPSCAPFLCGGSDTGCPSSCQAHADCVQGAHCSEGVCQSHLEQGTACSGDDACVTGHCTDGVCCLAASCGAYRCGAAGACETSCSSSAQCGSGHQCSSGRECEPISASPGTASEGGSCHLGRVSAPPGWRWLHGLALLASLGLARGRRRAGRRARLSDRLN